MSKKLIPANFWVIETGCDCDGVHTRGLITAHATLSDAEESQEYLANWSDGNGYYIIDDRALLEEYCADHDLDVNRYYYVQEVD